MYRYKSVKEFVADVRQNERQEIQAQLKKKSNSQHESGFLSRYTRALTFWEFLAALARSCHAVAGAGKAVERAGEGGGREKKKLFPSTSIEVVLIQCETRGGGRGGRFIQSKARRHRNAPNPGTQIRWAHHTRTHGEQEREELPCQDTDMRELAHEHTLRRGSNACVKRECQGKAKEGSGAQTRPWTRVRELAHEQQEREQRERASEIIEGCHVRSRVPAMSFFFCFF